MKGLIFLLAIVILGAISAAIAMVLIVAFKQNVTVAIILSAIFGVLVLFAVFSIVFKAIGYRREAKETPDERQMPAFVARAKARRAKIESKGHRKGLKQAAKLASQREKEAKAVENREAKLRAKQEREERRIQRLAAIASSKQAPDPDYEPEHDHEPEPEAQMHHEEQGSGKKVVLRQFDWGASTDEDAALWKPDNSDDSIWKSNENSGPSGLSAEEEAILWNRPKPKN